MGIDIRMVQRPDGLEVSLSHWYYVFFLVALGFFGPGILTLFVIDHEHFNPRIPTLVLIFTGIIVLFCTYGTLRGLYTWLWARPKLHFREHGISHTIGNQEKWHINAIDIASLRLEDYFYSDEGTQTRNPILVVESRQKEVTQLAIGSNEKQMEALLATVRQIYRLRS